MSLTGNGDDKRPEHRAAPRPCWLHFAAASSCSSHLHGLPGGPNPASLDEAWLTWAPGIEEQGEVAQHEAGALVAGGGLQGEAVQADGGIGWRAELQ
jgi:hypothetical protein